VKVRVIYPKRMQAAKKGKIEQLTAEHENLWNLLLPKHMNLVKQSREEIARLDQVLTPVIGMIRAELELPFDEEVFTQMITENHRSNKRFWKLLSRSRLLKRQKREELLNLLPDRSPHLF
jgi:hypothetical protein